MQFRANVLLLMILVGFPAIASPKKSNQWCRNQRRNSRRWSNHRIMPGELHRGLT